MNDWPASAPLITACRLWQQTSARTGKTYFVGTWGGLKVLVMENKNRSDEDTASHVLLVTERAPTARQAAKPAEGADNRTGPAAQRHQAPLPHPRGGRHWPTNDPLPEMPNDPVPF